MNEWNAYHSRYWGFYKVDFDKKPKSVVIWVFVLFGLVKGLDVNRGSKFDGMNGQHGAVALIG